MAFAGDKIRVRIPSVLSDVKYRNDRGQFRYHRALVPTLCRRLELFTANEIAALEELLNSAAAKERDFQVFFEQHPHFLRRWDHREVHAHVVLARPEGQLIPDFLLTDPELQRAAIVELKLPRARLVRRKHNRDRFAEAMIEARAQLLRYRDWFRSATNRSSLKSLVGMQVYEPQMIVVVGRSAEFRDELDRQRLRADNPDVELVTYDDLLSYARRRMRLVDGG